MRFFRVIPLLIVSLSLVSCSGKKVDENDPAAMFLDAEEDIQNDHYQVAIDKLRTIKNKFPYSKYSAEAQLRLGDVYFLQESFLEAAGSYESFRDLHPKHERIAYALFRVGLSYQNDAPTNIARDLTSAQKAIDGYNDMIRKYPNDPLAPEARQRLNDVRTQLADKELYIADFYYKREMYRAAAGRYERILEAYPETHASKKIGDKLKIAKEKAIQEKKEEDEEHAALLAPKK